MQKRRHPRPSIGPVPTSNEIAGRPGMVPHAKVRSLRQGPVEHQRTARQARFIPAKSPPAFAHPRQSSAGGIAVQLEPCSGCQRQPAPQPDPAGRRGLLGLWYRQHRASPPSRCSAGPARLNVGQGTKRDDERESIYRLYDPQLLLR